MTDYSGLVDDDVKEILEDLDSGADVKESLKKFLIYYATK